MFKRIHLIVLDSVGIGEQPDSGDFGDTGAHTLKHTLTAHPVPLPHLESLGLGCIDTSVPLDCPSEVNGFYSKMEQVSLGKDTMTGHWEIAGLNIKEAFRTYPNGFDDALIEKIVQKTGRNVVGNIPASGTEIIKTYGEHQMKTGDLIIYTSNDPVLQIAAHEEIIPLDELYSICEYVRQLTLAPEFLVGRVIARPFIGTNADNFERTANRRDYALSPPKETVLDALKSHDFEVRAIGKIYDIFNGSGITQSIKTKSNSDGVTQLLNVMNEEFTGLTFTNLVDFDANYGHRRDPVGYSNALHEFDKRLPEIIHALRDDDLLIITADHGNDPTFSGTDHTREYVPLLITTEKKHAFKALRNPKTFSDVAATIADNFDISYETEGNSILPDIMEHYS